MKIYWNGDAWCGEERGALRLILAEAETVAEVVWLITAAKKAQSAQRDLAGAPSKAAAIGHITQADYNAMLSAQASPLSQLAHVGQMNLVRTGLQDFGYYAVQKNQR